MNSRVLNPVAMIAMIAMIVGAATLLPARSGRAQPPEKRPRNPVVRWETSFSVREDAGVARRGEPVVVGVPVPLGVAAGDPHRFRVIDPSGRVVAADLEAGARWDGRPGDARMPLRWLRVRFLGDLDASETHRYRVVLVDDRAVPPPGVRWTLDEDAGVLVVDTGRAEFHVSTRAIGLFDRVELVGSGGEDETRDVARGAGGLRVVPGGGREPRFSAEGPAPRVRVVREAPRSLDVAVDGRIRTATHNRAFEGQLDHLDVALRYRFFAGSARVEVSASITNPERSRALDIHRGGAASFHERVDASLRLALPPSDRTAVRTGRDLGVFGELSRPSAAPRWVLAGDDRVTLYQDSSGGENWAAPSDDPPPWLRTSFRGYRYLVGGEPRVASGEGTGGPGRRSPGWIRVRRNRSELFVGVRDFWERYPNALRVSARGLVEIALLPGEWSVPHRLRGGVRRTTEICLDFAPGATTDEALEAWVREPLSAWPEAADLRDSCAAGLLSIERDATFAAYEREARAVIRYRGDLPGRQGDLFREREDGDLYGWMNFGDHYRGGSKAGRYFGNNELDFSWCLLLQYLRQPEHDADYRRAAEAMIHHLLDVDLYHTDRDLFWANRGVRKHDASGIRDHGNAPYTSHFWTGGLALYYALTGDSRAAEGLRDIGRWLTALERDRKGDPGYLWYSGEVRSRGWVLHALLDLYETFGEPEWLAFAERVQERMVRAAIDERGFIINSDRAVFPWQMGYVTDALGRYLWIRYRRGEEDEPALASLVAMLDWLAKNAWLEAEGTVAYNIDPIGGKVLAKGPNLSRIQSNGFAYGAYLTGRPDYRELAAKTFHSQDSRGYPYYYSTTLGTPAKAAGFRLRFGQVAMNLRQVPDDGAPALRVGAIRRIGAKRARILLDVDRPARVGFELAPLGSGDDSGTGAARTDEPSWRSRMRFPGPRFEPLAERPADPRSFLLRARAAVREDAADPVVLEVSKPGRDEAKPESEASPGRDEAKAESEAKPESEDAKAEPVGVGGEA